MSAKFEMRTPCALGSPKISPLGPLTDKREQAFASVNREGEGTNQPTAAKQNKKKPPFKAQGILILHPHQSHHHPSILVPLKPYLYGVQPSLLGTPKHSIQSVNRQ